MSRVDQTRPPGGSFPVTGCEPCLADLAQHMDVDTTPIPPASGDTAGGAS